MAADAIIRALRARFGTRDTEPATEAASSGIFPLPRRFLPQGMSPPRTAGRHSLGQMRHLMRRATPFAARVPSIAALLLLAAMPLSARPPVEKARLVPDADRTAYAPGTVGHLAAVVHVDEGWHVNSHQPTYDYLIPTRLEVTLPAGWEPAAISYPQPLMARFTFADEPLSVFEGTVGIVAAFKVPAATPAGDVPVELALRYQACNDTQCLPPVTRKEQAVIRVGADGVPSVAGWFATAQATGAHAAAPGPGSPSDPAAAAAPAGESAPLETTAVLAPPGDAVPAPPVAAAVAPATGAAPELPAPTAAPAAEAPQGLALILALGLLGGLILNAMPCVLPVLSIKVFSLVKSAALSRRDVVLSGLATTAGILVSFWALAGVAVIARQAGAAAGWGVQFQQPAFVALLAVIVVLFTLNMWGLFEIQLPASLAQVAGGGPREGLAGHFVTGLFATLMATPCSAPFLGPAVSFALTQNAFTVFAVFTSIGLGMAVPYLVLVVRPQAARLLPRPGAWMVRLREVMGFLLAAAAIWLFYVLAGQISAAALAVIQLAILGLALAVWLGRPPRPRWLGVVAPVMTLVMAAAAVGIAAKAAPARSADLSEPASGLIAWVPFDQREAERLAAAGTPVFVDVTADWCFTCKVNERFVLETAPVADAFTAHGVVPMRADWTNRDEAIGDLLAAHGRYGIPFYLLYRPGSDPHVFPELITQDSVIAAVRGAGQRAAR
jgi:thiol:disulfide interchange protein